MLGILRNYLDVENSVITGWFFGSVPVRISLAQLLVQK
jgi:hypothetical protein